MAADWLLACSPKAARVVFGGKLNPHLCLIIRKCTFMHAGMEAAKKRPHPC